MKPVAAAAPPAPSWDAAQLPPAAPSAASPKPGVLQRNYAGAVGLVAAAALVAAVVTAYATRGRLEDLHRFPVPRLPASSTVAAPKAVVPPAPVVPEPTEPAALAGVRDIEEPSALSLKLADSIDEAAATTRVAPSKSRTLVAPTVVVRPPVVPADLPEPVVVPVIERRDHGTSTEERAEAAFRHGVTARQNGDLRTAETRLEEALMLQPSHIGARQALASVLLDARRMDDLERVLREGTVRSPNHLAFAMAVARLEAERGDLVAAVVTLERAMKHGGEQNGELLALAGALLQRLDRHAEAADRYGAAIALGSANPVWFLGQAVSLREVGRTREARVRFRRALDSRSLSPELRTYAEKQLTALGAG
ncbi:MAG: tetratricopeptide repeat protein [Burkholderiales bacterium]